MTSQPLDTARLSLGLARTDSLTPSTEPELTLEQLVAIEEQRRRLKWKSFVDNELVRAKNERHSFERQWFINLAMYVGRQYVQPTNIHGYGFRLTVPKAPPHRVRLVINLTRKAIRKELAKLSSGKPMPTVVPATNEDEDQTAAIVSEQVLKAKFANSGFQARYREWLWWGVVTGASFLKAHYDPNEDDFEAMALPEFPEALTAAGITLDMLEQMRPDLHKRLTTPVPSKGKICYSVVNPFNLYVPDLMITDINDQPFVIQTMTKSKEWVMQRFGFEPNADARTASTALDAATIITKGREAATPDAVLVKECWIKPYGHKDFPQGGLITIINDKVVQALTKWPLPFGDYPFYQYRGIPTGGFYDDSSIVDLIPLQKEYNRTRSQMVEIKNTMGKPRLVYERGAINPRKLSSEPGQSVDYTPGFNPPIPMPGVEYPQSMVNETETLRSEFDDIAGQHEVSNGETPAGVTSGTALAFLNEQDESMLSYQVSGIEHACELLGTHYLKMAAAYWPDDRVIRITGKNNTFETIHWKKNSMEGNTDVRVQAGSALPQSKAAKIALITEMMQNGFLSPEVGLELMEFGNWEKAMEDYLVDKRQATRENLKIASGSDAMFNLLMSPTPDQNPQVDEQGKTIVTDPATGNVIPWQPQPPIPVNSWDNHEAHIRWHNQFRKGQEFEGLSEIKKKALELHVQLHQAALMYDQATQQGLLLQPGQMGGMQPGDVGPGDEDIAQPGIVDNAPVGIAGPQAAGGPISQPTDSMRDNFDRQQASQARH